MSQFMTVLIFLERERERESERVNRLVMEFLVPVKKGAKPNLALATLTK